MMKNVWMSFFGLAMVGVSNAFDYNITSAGSLFLIDNSTGIEDLKTLFTGDATLIQVRDVEWGPSSVEGGNDFITFITFVNGEIQDQGVISLEGVGRDLPTTLDVGSVRVDKRGSATIEVLLVIDGFSAITDGSYQVYASGVSIIPLLFILVMALTTHMVELSLFCGIWLGACIVSGSLAQGFRDTLITYLLERALLSWSNLAVILFTVFLSGMVGMMQKSGGMLGFTRDVAKVATTPRSGQFACMLVGIIIFFDDYSNVLLAGETMRPLLDLLSISREKLSFLVDATSAPIASISPISSWVGFEVGLINTELVKIEAFAESIGEPLYIKNSGFAIFLQSIKYRYYPIFMIIFVGLIIAFQRDFGPMLLAERQVRVYDRTDGGPNKGKTGEIDGSGDNQPREDQPLLSINMLLPVAVLVGLIFLALVRSGNDGSGTQTFMEKIENSDSFIALLYGTMGTAWIMIIFYVCQITIPGTGKLAMPTPKNVLAMMPWKEDNESGKPRFLMSVHESVEAFLFGMTRIFLALVVLTLAWASGAVMSSVGCDRLFAAWIVNGIPVEWLPTVSFLVSLLMALATGTSWGTMSILFPLILLPTYISAAGDELIFYAVVAGVLSGSVAGDHMSPISDTTVLSALACDVTLVAHVATQSPYVMICVLISVIFGTIPIGFRAWPNMVGIVLGWIFTLLFILVVCVPVISKTGRWDPFFKYCCGRSHDREFLDQLSEDCVKKFNGETVEMKDGEVQFLEDMDVDFEKEKGRADAANDDNEVDTSEEDHKPAEESPAPTSSVEEHA